MKKIHIVITALSVVGTTFGQGSLTPPGAPAPTMKTLNQVEARTPISAPTIITESGSYYVTQNITVSSGDVIRVTADNVTVDLNGFTFSSTDTNTDSSAIYIPSAQKNITIFNGSIQGNVVNNSGSFFGTGFLNGILGDSSSNVRISNISVSGCKENGIYLSLEHPALVEFCTVQTVGSSGIRANIIRSSIALACNSNGIYGVIVSDSKGESVDSDDPNCNGLFALDTAQNCSGKADKGKGLYAETAINCKGSSQSNIGLKAGSANSCRGISVSNTGLYAVDIAKNCLGTSTTGRGLEADIATGCKGTSDKGSGLKADVATSCKGSANTGVGLESGVTENCGGTSIHSPGLIATTASNSQGKSTDRYGLSSLTANNCSGESNSQAGLSVTIATGCYGKSISSPGIYAGAIVANCSGTSTTAVGIYSWNIISGSLASSTKSGGFYSKLAIGSIGASFSDNELGFQASYSATSCDGYNNSGYSVDTPHKYDMP